MSNENRLIGAGVVTALIASLCCITPVLAILAGTTAFGSTFSILEPFRPHLIGVTLALLVFAWYQKLVMNKKMAPAKEPQKKVKFRHSKKFLALITILVIGLLAFPNYSYIFYPEAPVYAEIPISEDMLEMEFRIKGMTCTGCEKHIDHAVNEVEGVISSKASFINGNTIVTFDKSKTNEEEIEEAINTTGYTVKAKNFHQ